jgi:hypothetical protein
VHLYFEPRGDFLRETGAFGEDVVFAAEGADGLLDLCHLLLDAGDGFEAAR